jgi:Protein kinase domain
MAALAPGTVVGRYRVDSIAGRGGMGVVYRATQLKLDRPVALKLISADLAEDSEFRERFRRESKIAARIEHPNVIPVYEADEADGRLFIAMRLIEGSDLATMLRSSGPLEPERAIHILRQVAGALDAAHRHGIVHRDVKPANVLMADEDGTDHAYLTDFGLTKQVGSSTGFTRTGMWVGTLDYIAPEQITGDAVDARADVYALGCVLFQALTGEVPFPRGEDAAKLYAHVHQSPPLLNEVRPDLPERLTPVLQRAMAKDPDERHPSAGDLARAAAAALEGRDSSTPERTVATGGAAPTRPAAPLLATTRLAEGARRSRRRLLWALSLVAAVAIAGAAALAAGVLSGDDGITQIDAGGAVGDLDADNDRVVLERAPGNKGAVLSQLDGEELNDFDGSRASDYAGVDVGLDHGGEPIVVYALCPRAEGFCDIWHSRLGGRKRDKVEGASVATCQELGPNVSEGMLVYRVRDTRRGCPYGLGLYLKPLGPGEQPTKLLAADDLGTKGVEFDDQWLAWVGRRRPPGRLGVARLDGGELSERRFIRPPKPQHSFQGPSLAIDDNTLYFVDEAPDHSFFIARTPLGPVQHAEFEHYPTRFNSAPNFAFSDGDLLYSENNDLIERDDAAEFEAGLGG